MKKAIVAAVLSGVLAGGILVSAGSIMADTTDNSQEKKSFLGEMIRSGGGMRGHSDMGLGFQKKQQEKMDEKFGQLVEDGVISEDQADKIKNYLESKVNERRAQMDELKEMTYEERKAFFEENKEKGIKRGIEMFDELVYEGIISQDQADKLAEKGPMFGHIRQRNWDSSSKQQE